LDAFTHNYALEYIEKETPRLLYISYGETDDFAHDGRYDHYLKSAHQTDDWIRELWEYVQSHPQYKDKTTFVITTDHGRGAYPNPKGEWKSHGKTYVGSNAIWMMAMGPDTPALGEVKTAGQLWQNQVAKTVAKFLGHDYEGDRYECGKAVIEMFENEK
jgi:arylsulfatase A-like enzyme